jgi:hypothetical protein
MSIIRPLTQAESDLAAKEQLVLQAGEATHHLASTLATTNQQFWSLPTDRLLAVLNADIPATLATFAANTALATQVNASLDALNVPRFSSRAPVEAGRSDIIFNGTVFEYVAPPEPEPEPEPEQQP